MAEQVVGIYGGTFDPVHLGHLAVAEEVREAAGLACLVFVPNRQQPLKQNGPYASAGHRLRMLQVAIAGNPGFAVDDLELTREGPSYTIDTLDQLHQRWPARQLRFVLGSDAANGLPQWRSPQLILSRYRPIVMSRAGWPDLDWEALCAVHPEARDLVQTVAVPDLAIASSDIRARVEAGRSIRYLVPEAVRAMIEDEGLYRSGTAS